MIRRLWPLLMLALLACQTPSGGEKGPALVAVQVETGALDAVYTPRRLALLIGIGDYQDEAWRDLRFAAKDAEDLAEVLRDPLRGRFDDVQVLTSPERTTRAEILKAVRGLRARATRPDDVVVVYVSGHGTLARDALGELRRYLVPRDAQFRDVVGTAISMDGLKREFDGVPSKRRLLVLATCHSGSGKSLLPPDVEAELAGIKSGFYARPLEASSRASMVFSAADWGETAREDEDLRNDIYTHFLLQALTGDGDRNVDGAVSATEAHDFARRRTFAYTQGRQRPSAEILEVGADPIILAGDPVRGGRPELYSYDPRLDGFTLKVDGEPRVELPGGTAVPPGKRTVQLAKGGAVLIERVLDIAPGERLDLEALAFRATTYRRTLSLTGGMFSFVDAASRRELLPSFGVAGLSLRIEGWPTRPWSLVVDASGSTGTHALRMPGDDVGVPFRFQQASLGGSLLWGTRLGRFGFYGGPRLAALWLQRSFQLQTYQGDQRYLTVTPGLMGSATFGITDRLELSLNAQLMGTWVMVDGAGFLKGFSGAWAGMGYRF